MRQAKQIAKRAMEFLMASNGESVGETLVTEEYIDCCLGSPWLVINFLQKVTGEWGLSSSAAVNYLKCLQNYLISGKQVVLRMLFCGHLPLQKLQKRKRQSEQKEKYGG